MKPVLGAIARVGVVAASTGGSWLAPDMFRLGDGGWIVKAADSRLGHLPQGDIPAGRPGVKVWRAIVGTHTKTLRRRRQPRRHDGTQVSRF